MRTTITLNDNIYQALKIEAAEFDESISSLIEVAVRNQLLENLEDLRAAKDRESDSKVNFKTFVKELEAAGLL
jgi:predicted CopG family antitoxin